MIGFGFWDSSNNACVNDNVLNLLDFPMESLESDGLDEDLDAKLQRLGPITWEALQRLSSTPTHNVRNGIGDLQSNLSAPSEQICQLNQKPEFFEETSSINNSHNSSISKEEVAPLEPCSPISALSSCGSSCSGEKNSPITLISPPINNSGLRRSQRKKKKLSQLYAVKQPPAKQQPTSTRKYTHCEIMKTPQWRDVPKQQRTSTRKYTRCEITKTPQWSDGPKQQPTWTRKCTHCEITRTPQWREGPKGPKTLCNACGVRYRCRRLFPEYRPAASPTFVPTLHSNNHKKVVEIRSGTMETAIVKESEGVRTPKSEKI